MIPLLDLFEHIRLKKKIKKQGLKEELAMTNSAFSNMYKSKVIPNDLIFGIASYLEIDTRNIDSLFQYNEREAIYRSLPSIVNDKLISDSIRYKITNILFFNINIEVNPVAYISQIITLPRELDEAYNDLKYEES